jgi:EAL and modified HD-GYP domain-containing signal transduction protein
MDEASFVVREPLLDARGHVAGYELSLHKDGDIAELVSDAAASAAVTPVTAPALVLYIAQQFAEGREGMFGDAVLYLSARPEWLSAEVLDALPPKRTVFRFGADDFSTDDKLAIIKMLRSRGFGVCLRDADLIKTDSRLPGLLSQIELDYSSADFAVDMATVNALKNPATGLLMRSVGSWADFNACAALGAPAFVGRLYLTPRPESQSRGLNPAQTMILQLMQLVRKNADVRELENVLKRDPAIAYKLLRYINSVGFGLGAEIQSLRHAVTMLGYSPLYRWLSLLLATASTEGYSPALMQAAIIRGRFAELLGQGFLPKNESENLFVAGMFSLLDRLLGVSMEEVLENVQLSDAVTDALLTRSGMYGPFLALAEACELHNGHVGELAAAAFIDAPKVNEAHLAAISWAQSLKL